MRRVAIAQSNYIPWKGYFDLIHDVDLFVFYDDVQFTAHDWRNRNRIKTPRGPAWLTIPVGTSLRRLICEVGIGSSKWQATHWKTLRQFYGRAPFFEAYEGWLRTVYLERAWGDLSTLNQWLIKAIAREHLAIRTEFLESSRFTLAGKKQDRVLDLLGQVQADVYVSGPAGKAYLQTERFHAQGIELVWKDYGGYPEYPQFYPPFEHHVTVLDLLLHAGPDAPYFIWGWRQDRQASPAPA